MSCIKINFFYFIFLIFYYRNMIQVWNYLIQKYGLHDFIIHVFGKRIFLLNNPETVANMHIDELGNITKAQQNLYGYLGLETKDNYYQWISTQIRFRNMIDNSNEKITKSIESNQSVFIKTQFTLNESVSVFMDRILAELMYGKSVDYCLFSNTCAMIYHYINHIKPGIFYFPIVGHFYRKIIQWIYRKEFNKIIHNLAKLYENSDGLLIDLAYDIYENNSIDIHQLINATTCLYCHESTYYKSIVLEYLVSPHDDINHIMSKHCQYPLQYKNKSGDFVFYHLINTKKYFTTDPFESNF